MRCVSRTSTGQRVLATGTVLLTTLAGCSSYTPPPQDTTVLFDGETYTIHAPVNCAMSAIGRLGIGINTEHGKKLIAVLMTREPPLVVYSVGFRHFNVRGYTNNPAEVFATKVDNTYTISGWMPPDEGEQKGHQFKFEVTCLEIREYVPRTPGPEPIPDPATSSPAFLTSATTFGPAHASTGKLSSARPHLLGCSAGQPVTTT